MFLREKLNIYPGTSMQDFEQGLLKAVAETWPGCRLIGCWFHMCKALKMRARQTLSLQQLLILSPRARLALKLYQRLALLPEERINEGLEVITLYCIKNRIWNAFKGFHNYFLRFWMRNVRIKI